MPLPPLNKLSLSKRSTKLLLSSFNLKIPTILETVQSLNDANDFEYSSLL